MFSWGMLKKFISPIFFGNRFFDFLIFIPLFVIFFSSEIYIFLWDIFPEGYIFISYIFFYSYSIIFEICFLSDTHNLRVYIWTTSIYSHLEQYHKDDDPAEFQGSHSTCHRHTVDSLGHRPWPKWVRWMDQGNRLSPTLNSACTQLSLQF